MFHRERTLGVEELIIRALGGDATPSEEEDLQRWRRESQENEAAFQRALGVWTLTEAAAQGEAPTPPSGELVAQAWQAQRDQAGDPSVVSLTEGRKRRARPSYALQWTVGLAASVAAVALGIQLLGWPVGGPLPIATFAAGIEDVATVTLEDGSRVRLAPGSQLEQWEAPGERRFTLTGRAFFAVARDPAMPFVIEAGGAEARVLGTRFDLHVSDGDLRTVVLDGRVAISNEEGRVEVEAGSMGLAKAGEAPTVTLPDDLYSFLDWPGGMLLFQETPLARVAEDVGRYFGLTVEVRTEQLRSFRISATFGEETFQEIVQSLCEVVAAECTVTDAGASIGAPR